MSEIAVSEAWRRFVLGNASRTDSEIIITDLMELTFRGVTVNVDKYIRDHGSLDNYPMYCALILAKQEIGSAIVLRINRTDEEILDAIRSARANIKRGILD